MKQVLVVFHLHEGSELEAEKLVAAEPPFDLEAAGFARLAVYLTHREAIFVFEGEEPEWHEDALIDDFLRPALRDPLRGWPEVGDLAAGAAPPTLLWGASAHG